MELIVEAAVCAKRNIHDRTLAELTKICHNWVKTPDHMINLDVRTLLQDDAIQEVEMEDAIEEDSSKNENVEVEDKSNDQGLAKEGADGDEDEENDDDDEGFRKVIRSKWDGDVSETNLGKNHSGLEGVLFLFLFYSSHCSYISVTFMMCWSLLIRLRSVNFIFLAVQ